jgi:cephalosporin hydroxylase
MGHEILSDYIELIEASSTEEATITKIKAITGESKEVLVNLDSDHTHKHVLKELEMYEQFVGPGQNLICGDTIVEDIPEQEHRKREWGPGNNPKTAMYEFLKSHSDFQIDYAIHNKLLFSCNPHGYLLRK